MTNRSKFLWGVVVAFVVGAIVGLGIGAYGASYVTASRFINFSLSHDASGVQRFVAILKHLRAGATDQAVELLESRLDDILIVMMEPSNLRYRIKPYRISQVNKAFHQAKEYRSAYPRKSKRTHVDEMVANVFSRGLYK